MCISESLCCMPEVHTTLLINSTPIENKNEKKKKLVSPSDTHIPFMCDIHKCEKG